MIHHASLGTNNLQRARAFYDPLMEELGLRCLKQTDRLLGYGLTEILFSLEKPIDGESASPGNGVHLAFNAGRRRTVDTVYKLGLANGGKDDGGPGLRTEYDPHYYAAFLRDPDGNKVEFVTFSAE
jgi:catechol 2,3-dioxygenase-like lactoylglutathione lyase family enzyme